MKSRAFIESKEWCPACGDDVDDSGAVMPEETGKKTKCGSCAVQFTWCLFIPPEGDGYTPLIKKEIMKTTLSSSPTGPFLSTSVEPYQVPSSPAGSQGGCLHDNGPPASWAGPSSCRNLPGTCPEHSAPCPPLRSWMQPRAPMGAPTLGGRGRNFKFCKYSSKAPMWLVKPPKIIAVKQLLL